MSNSPQSSASLPQVELTVYDLDRIYDGETINAEIDLGAGNVLQVELVLGSDQEEDADNPDLCRPGTCLQCDNTRETRSASQEDEEEPQTLLTVRVGRPNGIAIRVGG